MARVLVVSATDYLREVLRDLLEQEGHSVVEAAGRDEALAAAMRIDLLLVDVDGGPELEDLVRRFRQAGPARKVVTIGIPSDPAARGDAAVDHPIKSDDEVLRAVRRALGARP
jgi:CheY-like chemotaxis protein